MAYAIMNWANFKPENREVQVEANGEQRRPGRPARLSRAQILGAALDRDFLQLLTTWNRSDTAGRTAYPAEYLLFTARKL